MKNLAEKVTALFFCGQNSYITELHLLWSLFANYRKAKFFVLQKYSYLKEEKMEYSFKSYIIILQFFRNQYGDQWLIYEYCWGQELNKNCYILTFLLLIFKILLYSPDRSRFINKKLQFRTIFMRKRLPNERKWLV